MYKGDIIETHGLDFLLKLNTGMARMKKSFTDSKPSNILTYTVKWGEGILDQTKSSSLVPAQVYFFFFMSTFQWRPPFSLNDLFIDDLIISKMGFSHTRLQGSHWQGPCLSDTVVPPELPA